MRVTQNMLNRDLRYGIGRNFEHLGRLNEQLSTGRRVNTASDDVGAAMDIMRLARASAGADSYLRGSQTVQESLTLATDSLQTMSEALAQIKQLAVQAASETYTDADRQGMVEAIDQLLGALMRAVNVDNAGAYVFSGEATGTPPYVVQTGPDGRITAVTYQGESLSTRVEVAPGTLCDVNFVGRDVFQGYGDLFQTVIGLRDAVASSDGQQIEQFIGQLDVVHDGLRRWLANLGERLDQLQLMHNSMEKFLAFNQQRLSDRQDADIAEVSIDYNTRMTLLQIVLQVASGGINQALLNFL